MCGIAGFFQQQPASTAAVQGMLSALRRRGPDAEHVVGWNTQGQRNDAASEVGLIHTRLAIIDPRPEADQPFSNDDGSIWICYNGEVYDWQQHADELRAQGVQFKTHSDTEFILRGYEAWGLEDLLPKLRGMFAFAILDWNKREVFLARDRMGLKPLVYTTANDGLAFGSLVRSVLPSVPKAQRQFSPESIDAYLAHRYIPAPRTIFQHIHRLENAHYLHYRLDTQQLTKHCYWQPHGESGSREKAWQKELDTAIRIRTVADRPLGVFLSGGIDSSTIACRLEEQGFDQLQTFSAAFLGSPLDESPVAKQIADTLGLPNQAIPVPLTIANDFEQIIADLDEPFADPSSFPSWYLAQATTQHVKVVLGGDGGDELLGGYKRLGKHLRTSWRRLLRLPLPRMADMAGKGWRKIVSELRLNWLEAYSLRFSGMTPGQRAFLQPGLKAPAATYWRYPSIDALNQLSPLKQLLAVDLNNYLPEYILRKGDLCTMAHGLELRAPLLDHVWAERVMALPDSERFTQPAKKLFASVTERLASLDLFNLKKRGFNPPLKPWLQQDLHHHFAGLGQRLQTSTQGQINAARVERFIAEYRNRPALAEQVLQLLILDASLSQLEAMAKSC
ncbi:asparagine synthase (glutamine-hydrolyzing) [Fluviibacter phosphoraccumulans]|uniref:asparagine synthase (glutamine-hydrolyzing) n=1 Tax=Fluviibacter phosphoraccumulans TaxID=1751046 RepID=UPI0010B0B3D5|nr:asparagine synthase (glutamine-hydrolyzing) [Fluviibacter phosphoraccumulans]BCA66234.1 asparagine synthetase B [Fluviibacter phosphoraccumulans]